MRTVPQTILDLKWGLLPPITGQKPALTERIDEEAKLANPESVRNESFCVAAGLVVRSSVPGGDASRDGDDRLK